MVSQWEIMYRSMAVHKSSILAINAKGYRFLVHRWTKCIAIVYKYIKQ